MIPALVLAIGGVASWFATGPGLGHAAAGPELRTPGWRGSTVRVCEDKPGRIVAVVEGQRRPARNLERACFLVRLTDWCQCYRGTSDERLIDLDVRDFARLAAPSRGKVPVIVELI